MTALVSAGAVAKAWLTVLGLLAVQGTLLALVAYALTRLGKLRPAWQAALWLVVAAKLALPWGPAMPWSLSDLIASLTATHHALGPIIVTAAAPHAITAPAAGPAIAWLALSLFWLAGATFVVSRAVIAQLRMSRAARHAPDAPAEARTLLALLATSMFTRRRRVPRLVAGDADVGPHVVGILRPIIVVPPALLEQPALLRAVLLHELAHVRRLDVLGRIVQLAAGALMWWLPVVRFVNRRLDHAREAACDAWALETGDVSRPAYARLLVRMAQLGPSRASGAATLALAAQHALDARIAAVLGPVVHARLTPVHRIALVAFAVIALGGARSAAAAKRVDACVYTPQMAEALFQAFPQADLDGDGMLSRDEACDLQAELRNLPQDERASRMPADLVPQDDHIRTLLSEPLCCDCGNADVMAATETTTCSKADGVEP